MTEVHFRIIFFFLPRSYDSIYSFSHQFYLMSFLCQVWVLDKKQNFPGGSDGKASVYNAGDPGSIPGLGRSLGERNGNPLQDYCLENPMDRGAWQATVHGVVKSRTRQSDFTHYIRSRQKHVKVQEHMMIRHDGKKYDSLGIHDDKT